jgi:hypothetical protein
VKARLIAVLLTATMISGLAFAGQIDQLLAVSARACGSIHRSTNSSALGGTDFGRAQPEVLSLGVSKVFLSLHRQTNTLRCC